MSKLFIARELESEFLRLAALFSVITLTGPRQSGKTTLCKKLFPDYRYFNLEDLPTRELFQNDLAAWLSKEEKGLVIDEAHHLPEIFSTIQILVDQDPKRRFILTGSSNFSLLQSITQSLAGRTALLTLLPFSLKELKNMQEISTDTLIVNGAYPAVWCSEKTKEDVYRHYYNTYIERDVRQIINITHFLQFQQFVKLCAGRVGCEFNASSFAMEIGVSVKTIQNWLSVLMASYVVFLLPPYFRNIGKRVVKSHKLYFYDTGLASFLLSISNEEQLATHPLRGMLFENLLVLEFVKQAYNKGQDSALFFYRDSLKKEVDVVKEEGYRQLRIFEIKSAQSYHKDFVKNLAYFRSLFKEEVLSTKVLYDGEIKVDTPYNGYENFRSFFKDSP